MNNVQEPESSVRGKINGDTIFTAGSRRNCRGTRKRPLLRARKCLSNRKTRLDDEYCSVLRRRAGLKGLERIHENSSRINSPCLPSHGLLLLFPFPLTGFPSLFARFSVEIFVSFSLRDIDTRPISDLSSNSRIIEEETYIFMEDMYACKIVSLQRIG